MTSEEKRLISDCRIAVVGATEFIVIAANHSAEKVLIFCGMEFYH